MTCNVELMFSVCLPHTGSRWLKEIRKITAFRTFLSDQITAPSPSLDCGILASRNGTCRECGFYGTSFRWSQLQHFSGWPGRTEDGTTLLIFPKYVWFRSVLRYGMIICDNQGNVVFATEFARRYGEHGIVSTSVHPSSHLSCSAVNAGYRAYRTR